MTFEEQLEKARAEIPLQAQRELDSARAKLRKFEDDRKAEGTWKYITHIFAIVVGALLALGFIWAY